MLVSIIAEEIGDGTHCHSIQGNLGFAVYPDHGKSFEELYRHADHALSLSMDKGRNKVEMYH